MRLLLGNPVDGLSPLIYCVLRNECLPSPSNRLCYTSKCAFLNSLYDSGWPHSKFGAQPFENSKKRVLKVYEACIAVYFSMGL